MVKSFRKQSGSALAIGLVMMTAITVISVTAMQRSGIQGKMVSNTQHKEIGYHAAHGELEQIYHFYSTQASATTALSAPLDNFDVVNGEAVYKPIQPGHESHYNIQQDQSNGSYGGAAKAKVDLSSTIQHTGIRNSLVEGFSVGTFVEYGFIVTSQSTTPQVLGNPRQLSSQSIGVRYIAPAG